MSGWFHIIRVVVLIVLWTLVFYFLLITVWLGASIPPVTAMMVSGIFGIFAALLQSILEYVADLVGKINVFIKELKKFNDNLNSKQ